jgi:hypothetical protein
MGARVESLPHHEFLDLSTIVGDVQKIEALPHQDRFPNGHSLRRNLAKISSGRLTPQTGNARAKPTDNNLSNSGRGKQCGNGWCHCWCVVVSIDA